MIKITRIWCQCGIFVENIVCFNVFIDNLLQWLNINRGNDRQKLGKQCNLDTFRVLRQSFCGKFKIVCRFLQPQKPPFRMYDFLAMGMITLMMVMMRTAMGGAVLTEESVNDADCVYGEECIPSLKRNLDVFVPIAKCIFSNCKLYFSQLQNVFVQMHFLVWPKDFATKVCESWRQTFWQEIQNNWFPTFARNCDFHHFFFLLKEHIWVAEWLRKFFPEIRPLMGETNFTLSPTSKNPL